MKLQSMSLRRIMACVLSLLMIITALPLGVSANGGGGSGGDSGNKPLTVTADKYIVGKNDEELDKATPEDAVNGEYTVRIDVKGGVGYETIKPNADVILVVDNSGSMDTGVKDCNTSRKDFIEKDGWFGSYYECPNCGETYDRRLPDYCKGEITRINIARQVAKQFASGILSGDTENKLSVISFSSGRDNVNSTELTNNVDAIYSFINEMDAGGGTDYTDALQKAYDIIDNRRGEDAKRPVYVVFITDGAPGDYGDAIDETGWNGTEQAKAIKDSGATIYTIGIGKDLYNKVENNEMTPAELLEKIASDECAEIVDEADVDALNEILEKIKGEVNTIYAGTGATLTDVINTKYFEYVPGSLTVSDGTSAEIPDSKNITWDIGYITDKVVSLEFKVKLIGDYPNTAGSYNTNDSVLLEYTDPNKEEKSLDEGVIGDPYVIVPEQNVTVSFEAGDGGSFDKDATTSYNIIANQDDWDTTKTVPTPVPETNYEFAGWSLDENGDVIIADPDVIFTPKYSDGGAEAWTNRIYYAIFREKADVVIRFEADDNGSLSYGSETGIDEYTVPLPPVSEFPADQVPTAEPNEGYIFDGWYLNDADTKLEGKDAKLTPRPDDVSGSDEWTTRKYTAKFTRDPAYIVTGIDLYIESASATKADNGSPLTYNMLEDNISAVAKTQDPNTTIPLELVIVEPTAVDSNWYIEYYDNSVLVFETKVTITGIQEEVGHSDNTFTAEPTVYKDLVDTKYSYDDDLDVNIEMKEGILEITNATVLSYEVTITSGSDFKTFDGEPLTCYDEPTVEVTTHLSDNTTGTIPSDDLNIVQDGTDGSIWHITYVVNDVTLFAIDVKITGRLIGNIGEESTAPNEFTPTRVDQNTDVIVEIRPVTGTLTVYPKSSVNITFVAQEGGKLELGEQVYDSGENYNYTVQAADLTNPTIPVENLPTAVAKEGYIFDGWYLNNNELTYGVNITPAYDDVVDATEWTTRTYTAKFTRDPAYIVTGIDLYIESDSATKADDGYPLTWHELVENEIYVELIKNDETTETITSEDLTITQDSNNDAIWYIEYEDNGVTVFETEVKITGKQEGIGNTSNDFDATTTEYDDLNGTKYFYEDFEVNVIKEEGTLEITDAKVLSYNITITSGSDEKTYNEEPLTCYDNLVVNVTTKLSNGDDGNIDPNKLHVTQNLENPSKWLITYVDNGVTLFKYVVTITGSHTGNATTETSDDNEFTVEREIENLPDGVTVTVTESFGKLIVHPKPAVDIRFEAEVGGKLYLGEIVYNDGREYTYTVRSDALKSPIDDIMLPTAVADEGYIFHGWFIDDKKINDKKGLAQPEFDDVADKDEWTNRTYVAKFYPDPNYETDEEKDARTINKLTLDIISGSAQKEYDGKPLYERTKLDAVLRADLKDGTTIELPITVTKNSEDPTDGEWTITYSDNTYSILSFEIGIFGEQKNIATSDNEFYVTVINENEDIYKDNYDYIYPDKLLDSIIINKLCGKLTVTSPIPVEAKPVKYAITFNSGSAEKEYDGSALTCDVLSAVATLTMDGNATENVAPVVVQDSEFNYTVTIDYNDTYAIFDVVITGSQTSVGSSKNEFEVKVVDHNFAHGGTIGYNFGTLTVTEEDDDGGFIILPAGFLYIENNVIAPDGFAKDEFTYEVYDNNTGKLIETVTIDANDRSRGVMFAYNTEVYVVPVDMEVEGYNLVTTSDPSDATDDVYVSQDTTIEFTHVYTVQLNTEDHYAYIIGYEDGTVRPQGLITRAEVATIFYRLLSDEARAAFFTQDNNYVDVASDAWYNNAISTMTNAGLFNGYPDGTFNPDGPITRAELVKVAASFFGNFEPGTSIFSDTDGHWASDFIDEAYVLGIVNGYTDGTFKPDQYITRAEAMKIVNGILGRDSVTGDLIDDMVIWSDNLDPDAWYYYIVQEATNSHEYVIDNDEETWTAALPNRDWSELEKVDTEM